MCEQPPQQGSSPKIDTHLLNATCNLPTNASNPSLNKLLLFKTPRQQSSLVSNTSSFDQSPEYGLARRTTKTQESQLTFEHACTDSPLMRKRSLSAPLDTNSLVFQNREYLVSETIQVKDTCSVERAVSKKSQTYKPLESLKENQEEEISGYENSSLGMSYSLSSPNLVGSNSMFTPPVHPQVIDMVEKPFYLDSSNKCDEDLTKYPSISSSLESSDQKVPLETSGPSTGHLSNSTSVSNKYRSNAAWYRPKIGHQLKRQLVQFDLEESTPPTA